MNADNDRQIRAWLEVRDPGAAPARLRAAAGEVPLARRGPRLPGLDYVRVRVLGLHLIVRPLAVLVVVLALVAALVGAGLLWRWLQFPPRGLIAYTVPLPETGSSGIRVIAADGTGARQITASTPNLYEHSPRWSPDGRTLLFARVAELDAFSSCLGVGSVVLYDVASGTERVLVTDLGSLQEVGWSPSGDHVAFVGPKDGCGASDDLGLIDVASGAVKLTQLEIGTWTLQWAGETVRAVQAATVLVPPDKILPVDVPTGDGRYVASVRGPGRRTADHLEVTERASGVAVDLGAGGAAAWSPDGSALAFIKYTPGPSEFGVSFRDRLAIATTGTWQVRALADVVIPDVPGPDGAVRLFRLAWTPDGRSVYWIDLSGAHVVDIATGRLVELPAAVDGCDDLQWQPTPAAV